MWPYSQVNLDRMALQLALTKANPRRLYSPKMVLDLSSFSLVERRPASLEKAEVIIEKFETPRNVVTIIMYNMQKKFPDPIVRSIIHYAIKLTSYGLGKRLHLLRMNSMYMCVS